MSRRVAIRSIHKVEARQTTIAKSNSAQGQRKPTRLKPLRPLRPQTIDAPTTSSSVLHKHPLKLKTRNFNQCVLETRPKQSSNTSTRYSESGCKKAKNSPSNSNENDPLTLKSLFECCNNSVVDTKIRLNNTQTGTLNIRAPEQLNLSTFQLLPTLENSYNMSSEDTELFQNTKSQDMLSSNMWKPYTQTKDLEENSKEGNISHAEKSLTVERDMYSDKSNAIGNNQNLTDIIETPKSVGNDNNFIKASNKSISNKLISVSDRNICEQYSSDRTVNPEVAERTTSTRESYCESLLDHFPKAEYHSDHELNVNDIIIDISYCLDDKSEIATNTRNNRNKHMFSKHKCLPSVKSPESPNDKRIRSDSKTEDLDLTVKGSTICWNDLSHQGVNLNNNKTTTPEVKVIESEREEMDPLDDHDENLIQPNSSSKDDASGTGGKSLFEKFKRAKQVLKSAMNDTKKENDVSQQSKYINMDTSLKGTNLASEINARSAITSIVRAALRKRAEGESVQQVAFGSEVVDKQFHFNERGMPTKSAHIDEFTETFAKGPIAPLASFISETDRHKDLAKNGEQITKFSWEMTDQAGSYRVTPTSVKTIIQKNDKEIVAFPEALNIKEVPICTLRIQWRLYHSQASPTLPQVFALLNRIIQCLCVVRVSANSACATFLNFAHAQHVMRSLAPVQGPRLLIASWWWGETQSRKLQEASTTSVKWLIQQYKDLILKRTTFQKDKMESIADHRRKTLSIAGAPSLDDRKKTLHDHMKTTLHFSGVSSTNDTSRKSTAILKGKQLLEKERKSTQDTDEFKRKLLRSISVIESMPKSEKSLLTGLSHNDEGNWEF